MLEVANIVAGRAQKVRAVCHAGVIQEAFDDIFVLIGQLCWILIQTPRIASQSVQWNLNGIL